MNEDKILLFKSRGDSESWGNLYRAVFDLRPVAPGGATHLCIWLYADSPESAGRNAAAIAQQLPYMPADPYPVVFGYPTSAADDSALPSLNAEYAVSEKHAKAFGLSFMFFIHAPAR